MLVEIVCIIIFFFIYNIVQFDNICTIVNCYAQVNFKTDDDMIFVTFFN